MTTTAAGKRSWFRFQASKASFVDLYLFDVIGAAFGGVDARAFVETLAELPPEVKTIRLRVNSPGGDPFDGVAIANALREHPARVETTIEGLAASSATIVTSGASDHVRIYANALVYVHEPWTIAGGDSGSLRKVADSLDQVMESILTTYLRRSKLNREQLVALMEAETWMLPEEAVANGFADEVIAVEGEVELAAFAPQAIAALKVPERYAARIAALVRQEPAPPVPQGQAAPAVDVLRVCAEAGIVDLTIAQDLVHRGATAAEVQALVADEKKRVETAACIRALCKAAQLPQFADSFIKGGMAVAFVHEQLTRISAMLDAVEIDGHLPPDERARRRASINTVEIYKELNKECKS